MPSISAMSTPSRRTLLAAATATAAAPFLTGITARDAYAAARKDNFASNTALYADPSVVEGTDYARRHRRHAMFDDSRTERSGFARSVILAPHGGGIETGTSELCLAIAGYHPKDLAPKPPQGPVHDYWMFEGIRKKDNGELHVTSTHCDDHVARSLCAGSLNALSLHGCKPEQAQLPSGTPAVLVGGLNATLRSYLIAEFKAVGIRAQDATGIADLAGTDPDNIANRTMLGKGAQLEITTPLRESMFPDNSADGRKENQKQIFWDFVDAARAALQRLEAGQKIL
ncbi:poly-gamma-glutamate hydrolase family protein [Streptomyces sp. NPDC059788]|uniref:poly-gamma-glutamate hydrolase family protein n=1 Tax=Streptomyces sp. NPDC059788 TaxID=3346948 RepID=UPI003662E36F